MSPTSAEVDVEGKHLKLSNLDKVLWPQAAFTKGQMIDYYRRIAPVMLPHLVGRAITLRRWPDGVDGPSFYEKNCPSHRPDWLATVRLGDVDYCGLAEPAALAWTANLAAIELHPTLARAPDLQAPTAVVFDLDPGPGTDVVTCCRVAEILRQMLDRMSLTTVAKTSGSKGLQLYVPVEAETGYSRTRSFSHRLARLVESSHPELVVTVQDRALRDGKVLIDWSQNAASKTTVAAYSLRARERPSVSTPVTWDEVGAALRRGDPESLRFGPDEVVARVERHGDLMAAVLEAGPALPDLS